MKYKFSVLKTADVEKYVDLKEVFKFCDHKKWQTNKEGIER